MLTHPSAHDAGADPTDARLAGFRFREGHDVICPLSLVSGVGHHPALIVAARCRAANHCSNDEFRIEFFGK
jgi:hypothetical protein